MIVDPIGTDELPDGHVGEIWLQGNNIGRGYWGRPEDTEKVFHARLGARQPKGHAGEADIEGDWLRTGDMGFYLDGELYVTGRLADHIEVDGSSHYPQDIEASVAAASPIVRRGYVTAFTVPGADWSSSPSAPHARPRPTRRRPSTRSAPRSMRNMG